MRGRDVKDLKIFALNLEQPLGDRMKDPKRRVRRYPAVGEMVIGRLGYGVCHSIVQTVAVDELERRDRSDGNLLRNGGGKFDAETSCEQVRIRSAQWRAEAANVKDACSSCDGRIIERPVEVIATLTTVDVRRR